MTTTRSRTRPTAPVPAYTLEPISISDSDDEADAAPTRIPPSTSRSIPSTSPQWPSRRAVAGPSSSRVKSEGGSRLAVNDHLAVSLKQSSGRLAKRERQLSSPSILVPSSSSPPTFLPIPSTSPPATAGDAASDSDDGFFNLRSTVKKAKKQKRASQAADTFATSLDATTQYGSQQKAPLGDLPSSSQLSQGALSSSPQYQDSSDEDSMGWKHKKIVRLPSWTRSKGTQGQREISSDQGSGSDWGSRHASQDGGDQQEETGKSGGNVPRRRRKSASLTPPPATTAELRKKVDQLLATMLPAVRKRTDDDSSSDPPSSPEVSPQCGGAQARDGSRARSSIATTSPSKNRYRAKAISNDPSAQQEAGDDVDLGALKALHPDLAHLYRGERAAAVRKAAEAKRTAMLEEENQRRKARDEVARNIRAAMTATTASSLTSQSISLIDSDDDGQSPSPNTSHPNSTAQRGKPQQRREGLAPPPRTTIVESVSPDPPGDSVEPLAVAASASRGGQACAADVAQDNVGRIALTLRSSSGQTMELKVRSTTTFGKMLDHFLMTNISGGGTGKNSAAQRKKARLVFDGKALLPTETVQDVEDLEDGELIDVVC